MKDLRQQEQRPPNRGHNIAANPTFDVSFVELMAELVAEAYRRARKEGRFK